MGELPPIPTAPDRPDARITSCCANPTAPVWSEVACQWERKGGPYVPGPANHTATVVGATARGEASAPAPRMLMRTMPLHVRRLSAWPMYEAAAALEDGMLWHIYTAHAKVDWGTAQDTCSHCASLLSLCSAAVNFGYGMARAAPDTLPWRDSRSGAVSEARGQYPC